MSADANPAPSANPLPPFFASERVWAASVLGGCIVLASLIWTFGSRPVGRYQPAENQPRYIVDTATGEVDRQ